MAQVVIKSPDDLINIFNSLVCQALEATRDEIYKAMYASLEEYYSEPVFDGGSVPKHYERIYKMLNSIIKTDIVRSGNSFSCTIEADPDYLGYKYSGGATGQDVLEWANAKTHGGTVKGDLEVWNDVIENFGGEQGIIALIKGNLKKFGVSVL